MKKEICCHDPRCPTSGPPYEPGTVNDDGRDDPVVIEGPLPLAMDELLANMAKFQTNECVLLQCLGCGWRELESPGAAAYALARKHLAEASNGGKVHEVTMVAATVMELRPEPGSSFTK